MRDGQYAGHAFSWFSPFAVLCGVGLCLGYALLGAAWLCNKTADDVRDLGFRLLPRLLFGVLLFLVAVTVYAISIDLRVLHRWLERPEMLVLPLIGAAACAGLLYAVRRKIDALPFPLVALIFATAFGTLAASFLPYMVPFSVTIEQAAAPEASLSFMFWGAGVVVLPITLIYTLVIYWVFKGKVALSEGYD